MATTIGELFIDLNANTSNFENGMNNASNKANGFKGVMGSVTNAVKGFIIYDVGKKLVEGFGNAIKSGIDYNSTLETSAIKWETLLGTQDKANKMLKDIEKFAKETPFEKMGVEAMATQLHNAGFEGEALFNQISKFGDMAGAFGIQSDSLQEMVRQYSQVKQAGVAYTEDLNILQDRGIPIFKALGEELGINTADVKKWASEGKITAEVYQAALDNLAKGVEGGMDKQSKSFSGMLSTLQDGLGQVSGLLAKPLFDVLAKQLEKAIPFVDKIVEAIGMFSSEMANGSSMSEAFLTAISNVFGEHVMAKFEEFMPFIQGFIGGVVRVFNSLKDNIKIILDSIMGFWNEHSNWIMPLISFVWGFISSFIGNTINAIGQVVQSGLAIIDGIINFFQNLFKGNFEGAWESIKQIFSNAITFVWNYMQVQFASSIMGIVKNLGKSIPQAIKFLWESAKNFFSTGVSGCINFVKSLFTSASNNFNMLKTFGANTFQALWSIAKTAMSNLLNSVITYISRVPNNIRNFMNQAINVLKRINLFDIGKNMIQGLINGIKNMASSVVGAIGGVVSGAIDKAKKTLGINSPSKVFYGFGINTDEGLIEGIEKKSKDVAKASSNLSSSVIDGYNVKLSNNIKSGFKGASNGSNANQVQKLLHIENFYNNTDKDIEYLANELAFYLQRKNIAIGGV